jgi:hypothetical protein
MVENITNKVKKMERRLPKMANSSNSSILVPDTPVQPPIIRVVSTYGSDNDLVDVVKRLEPTFAASRSFSMNDSLDSAIDSDSACANNRTSTPIFKFVKRTGSSLRNKLVKVRHMALGSHITKTVPCRHRNCGLCDMIAKDDTFIINGTEIKAASGDCSSYNIVYIFLCKFCVKKYVGRTVQFLRTRVTQHRNKFYRLLEDPSIIFNNSCDDDTYSLGAHLIDEHGCTNRADFNKFYDVFILMNSSPTNLEVNEHKFIQRLKTLKPFGINSVDPFGIPLLDL